MRSRSVSTLHIRTSLPPLEPRVIAASNICVHRVLFTMSASHILTFGFCRVVEYQKSSRTGSKHLSSDYLREHSQRPHPTRERIGSQDPHQ